jgi:DNA replication initiation complex subunit (GINS family)
MAEITITYETLYDLLRREKNRAELQELDPFFYEKLAKYINDKQEILGSQEQKDSIFTTIEVQKTRKQIENIQKIVKELYEKRESKILQLALMNSRSKTVSKDKSLMLNSEKGTYDLIIKSLNEFREDILHNIAQGKPSNGNYQEESKENEPKGLKKDEKPTINTKKVKFMQRISKFVGTDLNHYGPYEKGDLAALPMDIAELLINKNQVKEANENT